VDDGVDALEISYVDVANVLRDHGNRSR